ncbi:type II toxin-antitoxin system Phd/YefM family antitoxin [Rhizobium halophilum]|uniref:hypothetical protein n=1 Tax=Rhizobium halophilum TaxID=2846852 RepID=UPI001EFC612A|nr:hypothetical protein [Rhizobium halophilum]MCF6367861.1 hypothetical protein [Rhizobium halophilum]
MAQARRVTATEFTRSFGKYRDEALSAEVIEVTSHGRVIGGYLGAKELAHYQRLKEKEREVIRIADFDEEMLAELGSSEYGVIGK